MIRLTSFWKRFSLLTGIAFSLMALASCLDPGKNAGSTSRLPENLTFTVFYDTAVARFHKPVWFEEVPGSPGTFAVGGLGGDIQLMSVDTAGGTTIQPFAQIPVHYAPYIYGLLGATFHPDFATNRKYYVYYTSGQLEVKLVERMAMPNTLEDAGVQREMIVLPVDHSGHYGGTLGFGPDGYLYLGIGDGARANAFVQAQEALNADAQSLAVLYGKVIRIDVNKQDSGLAYAIPPDNPFAGSADSGVLGEIWAYGLRQPWRGSIDPHTGRLFIGDVGLVHSEEINLIEKGKNYGWRRLEGSNCFNDADFWNPLPDCITEGFTPPLVEIKRPTVTPDLAIIGGSVFRGDTASPHYGAYIFGESTSGAIYYVPAAHLGGHDQPKHLIAHAAPHLGSFGTDSRGNLYVVEYHAGRIRRIDHPDLTGRLETR